MNTPNIRFVRDQFAVSLRALRYRNFRLYFFGQGVSMIGTFMQQTALQWVVYQLTGSPLMLGLIAFAGQFPVLLFGPISGAFSDRVNRHRLIIATQIFAACQAVALAILTFTGLVQVWHLFTLSLALGLISAFDIPSRQAFVFQTVDLKDDIGNAVALQSSIVNIARMIGPAAAGLLIKWFPDAGLCFLINALSFLAVIVSLLMMRVKKHVPRDDHPPLLADLKDGVRYVFGFGPTRAIILTVALGSVSAMAFTILMPVYAKDVFHGGPSLYGNLQAAAGLGALIGAIYLAGRRNVLGLSRVIAAGGLILGTGMIAFAFSPNPSLAMMLRLVACAGQVMLLASCNTMLQTITDEKYRGRVMSFYTMAFAGMMPVGAMIGGSLAEPAWLGPQAALAAMGALCILGCFAFLAYRPVMRRRLRPIYQRLGILPTP